MLLNDADIKTDILYGLFVGWNCIRGMADGFKPYKSWSLDVYTTAKGRTMGMQYQKREYVDCDFLTFELTVLDLFKMAKLIPVIVKDRARVVEDVVKFIKEK